MGTAARGEDAVVADAVVPAASLPQGGDVVTADDVAALLGVNRKTVYDAAARGDLPSRRLGRRVLFSRSAVLEWLQCKASSERAR